MLSLVLIRFISSINFRALADCSREFTQPLAARIAILRARCTLLSGLLPRELAVVAFASPVPAAPVPFGAWSSRCP